MDKKSEKAAADLYRLASAGAILRLYCEAHGHEAESVEAVYEWALQRGLKNVKPTDADYEGAIRENPELALIAGRSNPFLSGQN